MKSSKSKSPPKGAKNVAPLSTPAHPSQTVKTSALDSRLRTGTTTQMVSGANYIKVADHPTLAPGLYVDIGQRFVHYSEALTKGAIFVAGPFAVLAHGRDSGNESWGVHLRWNDLERVEHTSLVLFSKISGPDSSREIARLRGAGLQIAPSRKAVEAFIAYLLGLPKERFIRSVRQVGWHGDVFVRPDMVFGTDAKNNLIEYNGPEVPGYKSSGDLDQWRTHVAKPCEGNSRLVFVLSMSFTGYLLNLSDMEGGGIHLHGQTSEGKSVALTVAASVHGDPATYGHEWATTSNAIEVTCAGRNHQLLVIDELGRLPQIKHAAYIVYTIANGSGKARMTVDGEARTLITWSVMVLSGGEVDLEMLERESGTQPRGGAQIRMASLPSNAGSGMGIVETLHGAENSKVFVDNLQDGARKYFGTASIAFLQALTFPENLADVKANLPVMLEQRLAEMEIPADATSEVMRVAKRFALIAVAGELATLLDVTGWQPGEAVKAAVRCFKDWHEARQAKTPFDELEVLRRIKHRIEAALLGGLVDIDAPASWHTPQNLLGFIKRNKDDETLVEYWIQAQQFNTDLLKGVANPAQIKRMLVERGWLIKPEKDHYTSSVNIPRLGKTRIYRLDGSVIAQDEL